MSVRIFETGERKGYIGNFLLEKGSFEELMEKLENSRKVVERADVVELEKKIVELLRDEKVVYKISIVDLIYVLFDLAFKVYLANTFEVVKDENVENYFRTSLDILSTIFVKTYIDFADSIYSGLVEEKKREEGL